MSIILSKDFFTEESQIWEEEVSGNGYRPWVAGKVFLIIMLHKINITTIQRVPLLSQLLCWGFAMTVSFTPHNIWTSNVLRNVSNILSLSGIHKLLYLVPRKTPWSKYYYYVHLTDETLRHRILSELPKISQVSLLRCSYAKVSTIEMILCKFSWTENCSIIIVNLSFRNDREKARETSESGGRQEATLRTLRTNLSHMKVKRNGTRTII